MGNPHAKAFTRRGSENFILKLLQVFAPGLVILAVAGWAGSLHPDYPTGYLMRDTAAVLEGPFFAGIVSQIGIPIFFGAGFLALFTSRMLRNWGDPHGVRKFFLHGGIIMCVLAADDMAQLHEEVIPNHIAPLHPWLESMGEVGIMAVYASAVLWYLWHYRQTIFATDWKYLAVAIGLLGASVLVDRGIVGSFVIPSANLRILAEDGAKFLGIIGWLYYYGRTGQQAIAAACLARTEQGGKTVD